MAYSLYPIESAFLTYIYLHLHVDFRSFFLSEKTESPHPFKGEMWRIFWQFETEIFYHHHHIYWGGKFLKFYPRFAFFDSTKQVPWKMIPVPRDPRIPLWIPAFPNPRVPTSRCASGKAAQPALPKGEIHFGPSFGVIGISLVEVSHLFGFIISYTIQGINISPW